MAFNKALLDRLSLAEKYDLLDDLVIAIHEQEKHSPLPEWQLKELKKRLEALYANPNEAEDAETFLSKLERE